MLATTLALRFAVSKNSRNEWREAKMPQGIKKTCSLSFS